MPFDQKRINGPDNSMSYKQFITTDEHKKHEGISDEREDGRKFNEHRKFGKKM
jgi:hypothetical protein